MWLITKRMARYLRLAKATEQPQRDLPRAEAGGKGVEDDQGRSRHLPQPCCTALSCHRQSYSFAKNGAIPVWNPLPSFQRTSIFSPWSPCPFCSVYVAIKPHPQPSGHSHRSSFSWCCPLLFSWSSEYPGTGSRFWHSSVDCSALPMHLWVPSAKLHEFQPNNRQFGFASAAACAHRLFSGTQAEHQGSHARLCPSVPLHAAPETVTWASPALACSLPHSCPGSK